VSRLPQQDDGELPTLTLRNFHTGYASHTTQRRRDWFEQCPNRGARSRSAFSTQLQVLALPA
jgi:hypothetical protein